MLWDVEKAAEEIIISAQGDDDSLDKFWGHFCLFNLKLVKDPERHFNQISSGPRLLGYHKRVTLSLYLNTRRLYFHFSEARLSNERCKLRHDGLLVCRMMFPSVREFEMPEIF